MGRFEKTWNIAAHASSLSADADEVRWQVIATGPNWRTDALIRTCRWDDLIAERRARWSWTRLVLGLLAFGDFVVSGALVGYLRTNWRYAVFFLYPYLVLAGLVAAAVAVFVVIARTGWPAAPAIGFVMAAALFFALLDALSTRLHLDHLLDDWIFAHDYIHKRDPELERRLRAFSGALLDAARAGDADELLVVGHSLGAVLAVAVLASAVREQPDLGRRGPRVCLLTTGSSLLKIGLHR